MFSFKPTLSLSSFIFIAETGNAVDSLLYVQEMPKSEIDYAAIKADWQEWMDDPDMAQYAEIGRAHV